MKKVCIIILLLWSGVAIAGEGEVEWILKEYNVKTYSEAVKILKNLAKQKDGEAQFHLGMLYTFGKGVKQSSKHAYKWFYISGIHDFDDADKGMDAISGGLSPAELLEAQRLAEKCINSKFAKCK